MAYVIMQWFCKVCLDVQPVAVYLLLKLCIAIMQSVGHMPLDLEKVIRWTESKQLMTKQGYDTVQVSKFAF